jgi:ligand-binding sensor domain-containing protein
MEMTALLLMTALAQAEILPAASRQPHDREFALRVFRTQDGLPENRVQAVSETPDGYLWIGTAAGLVRFDGAKFVVYSRANTPAFADDSVRVLYTAPDGVLWAGTEGGGLLRLKNGGFRSYGRREGLTDGFVNSIYQDSQGALWTATAHGLFRLGGKGFIRIAEPPGLPVSAFWSVSLRDNELWALSTVGWYRIDGDRLTGQPTRVNGSPEDPRCAAQPPVGRLRFRDHAGDLWIGTIGDGLIRIHDCAMTRWRSPGALPGSTVNSIFEDSEHSLWVGTEDGLLRMSRGTVATLNEEDGFSENNISNVYRDSTGMLWVTTSTGQVYRLVDGHVVPFKLPAEIGNPRIRTVFRDSHGTLWLGSADSGAVGLSTGRIARISTKDGLRSNAVNSFFEDRAGRLWIATSSGLSLWDGKALRNYYLEDGLVYGNVRALAEDAAGDLIVGTDGGLSRVHENRIVADPLLAGLGREKIQCIHVDSNRSIWLGTRGGGLIRVRDGKIARLSTDSGLLSKSIFQVLEDGRGRLWMSSPAGIFSGALKDLNAVADGRSASLAVSAYGIADGMETTQMSGGIQPAGALMADGRLAFPSVKGLVIVNPALVRIEKPSPVRVESVLVDDTPVPLSGHVTVGAGRRKLQIDFTACSLRSP